MSYLAASLVVLACVIGIALTILSLPGIWLMVLAAMSVEIWQRGTFSLWTLGAAVAIALVAEVAEMASSAVGAKKAGASKRAMIAATVGGIVGAIVGTVVIPVPIVGTILGGAIGAGIGAAGLELTKRETDTSKAATVAAGAFAGRLVATVIKGGFAVFAALILSIAAFA